MIIRPAWFQDLNRLTDMAVTLVTESPALTNSPLHVSKTEKFLVSLIRRPNGILLVAEENGFVLGAMAGEVAEFPFSYSKYALDYGLFVTKGNRGSVAARLLVKGFEGRAHELGAEDVRLGIMTGGDYERTAKFYERLGYKRTGAQFVKGI